MKSLLCITGPTAVGKSAIAIEIAKILGTDIISADSMQIYRGMNIGTAKPTIDEQKIVKHHLIDIVNPNESFSSFLFKKNVEKIICNYDENKIPLIVGGTGFYFDTLLYPLDFEVDSATLEYREELKNFVLNNGKDELYRKLTEVDPITAQDIHPNNVKRVIRALEIAKQGVKKSNYERKSRPNYPNIIFSLNKSREKLYYDIDKRVDKMLEIGLLGEVEKLYEEYHNKEYQSLQGIGYKELIEYIDGNLTLQEAVDTIKKNSRNYAKRQITFIKRLDTINIDVDEINRKQIIDKILMEYEKYSIK